MQARGVARLIVHEANLSVDTAAPIFSLLLSEVVLCSAFSPCAPGTFARSPIVQYVLESRLADSEVRVLRLDLSLGV